MNHVVISSLRSTLIDAVSITDVFDTGTVCLMEGNLLRTPVRNVCEYLDIEWTCI